MSKVGLADDLPSSQCDEDYHIIVLIYIA
jgi:hypothetical protein